MKDSNWIWVVVVVAIIAVGAYLILRTSGPSTPALSVATSTASTATTATFYCTEGQMTASFNNASATVSLALPGGTSYTLPEVMSGSGIRYESTSTGQDVVFQGEGAWGQLSSGTQTLMSNCIAARVASLGNGNNLFTDETDTFSFTYPSAFLLVGGEPGYTQDWMVNATTSGLALAEVDIPQSFEPKTNFVGAKFTVGTSADPSALATCLTYNPNQGTATTTTINGVMYSVFQSTGAAAGNRYDTTSYRTINDGQCYAIEYTIHSGAIQNYPLGTVSAFNEPQLQSTLDAMAQSFKFLL